MLISTSVSIYKVYGHISSVSGYYFNFEFSKEWICEIFHGYSFIPIKFIVAECKFGKVADIYDETELKTFYVDSKNSHEGPDFSIIC